MLIYDEDNRTILLDSIHTPTPTEYIWVFDLNLMEYTLTQLVNLEEIISPAMQLDIGGFQFFVPTYWNMLVFSEETSQLDIVTVDELAGKEFTAFVVETMPTGNLKHRGATVTITDYNPNYCSVVPQLGKHHMLCHPVSPTKWINIAPSDTYNKYLKELVIGDIIY